MRTLTHSLREIPRFLRKLLQNEIRVRSRLSAESNPIFPPPDPCCNLVLRHEQGKLCFGWLKAKRTRTSRRFSESPNPPSKKHVQEIFE